MMAEKRKQEPILFLSTPSARRATRSYLVASTPITISIHALREEGDDATGTAAASAADISIHALREEGDTVPAIAVCAPAISIHALREEGDSWPCSRLR